MGILTGNFAKEEIEPLVPTVEECLEEIAELRAQVEALLPMLEHEKTEKEDMRKEMTRIAEETFKRLEALEVEDDDSEVEMLRGLLESERTEHANTRRLIGQMQKDMTKMMLADEKEDKKEEAQKVTLDVVQRDENGRTRKIVMTKG